ncbi:MAG: CBS domain-containing protein [Candidatus Fermentibacteraceae bacterium]
MQVREIMTPDVEHLTHNDTAVTAARKMRDIDVGALPVMDDRGQLAGIVTDRDIVVRSVAEEADPSQVKVGEIMTGGAVSCPEEQSVDEAARTMEREQIRRLVVVDKNNIATGMVSLADIAVKTADEELAGEAVEEISKPAQPKK